MDEDHIRLLDGDDPNSTPRLLRLIQSSRSADSPSGGWTRTSSPAASIAATARALPTRCFRAEEAIGLLLLVAKTTTFGIVALPPIVGARGLMAISGQMPRRTAQGTAVLRRTLGFRRFIEDAETHRSEFAEEAGLLYEYLPYVIVFGCVDRWARPSKAPRPRLRPGTGRPGRSTRWSSRTRCRDSRTRRRAH